MNDSKSINKIPSSAQSKKSVLGDLRLVIQQRAGLLPSSSSSKTESELPKITSNSAFPLTELDIVDSKSFHSNGFAEDFKSKMTGISQKKKRSILPSLYSVEDCKITSLLHPPFKVKTQKLTRIVMKKIKLTPQSQQDTFFTYFDTEESKMIISNMFWFVFCAFFDSEKLNDDSMIEMIENVAKTATEFFWRMKKEDRDLFFDVYHYAVSYSIVRAMKKHFQGSKQFFTKEWQFRVFELLSEMFTGIRFRKNLVKSMCKKLFPIKKRDFMAQLEMQKKKIQEKSGYVEIEPQSKKGFYSSDEDDDLFGNSEDENQSEENRNEDKIIHGDDQEDHLDETDPELLEFVQQLSNPTMVDTILSSEGFVGIDPSKDYVREQAKKVSKPVNRMIRAQNQYNIRLEKLHQTESIATPKSMVSGLVTPNALQVRDSKIGKTRSFFDAEFEMKKQSPRYKTDGFRLLLKTIFLRMKSNCVSERDKKYWSTVGMSPLIGLCIREPAEFHSSRSTRLIRKNSSIYNAMFFGSDYGPDKHERFVKQYKKTWVKPKSKQMFGKAQERQAIADEINKNKIQTLDRELEHIKKKNQQQQQEISFEKQYILEDETGERVTNMSKVIVKEHKSRVPKTYAESNGADFKGTQLAFYAQNNVSDVQAKLLHVDKVLNIQAMKKASSKMITPIAQ